MKAFLFGLGLGIGLGVLFAPMSGQETRDSLSEKATDLARSARETIEQGKDRIQRGVSSIRGGETRPTGTEPTTNSQYGQPLFWQQPRTIRLGLKFTF